MIINIEPYNFSTLRNGDMIALLNYLWHLRKHPPLYGDVQFHVPDRSLGQGQHCKDFRDFLVKRGFLSEEPGTAILDPMMSGVNLWEVRSQTGDLVKLNINVFKEKLICIAPVMDAPYNTYRNWSNEMLQDIINHYEQEKYDDYGKILCVAPGLNFNIKPTKFAISTDLIQNLHYIAKCSHYIGGDTGTSHYASAIDDDKKRYYFYGSVGLLHTTPFYAMQGQGKIIMFNHSWNLDPLNED